MITLHYPIRNRIGVEPVWRPRVLTVVERIDLLNQPVPLEKYLKRPMIRRGRWLLRCFDHEAKQYRQFYENAFKEYWRPETLVLGELPQDVIAPKGKRILPVKLAGPFEQNMKDRAKLEVVLRRLKNEPGLVVYSEGLRLLHG